MNGTVAHVAGNKLFQGTLIAIMSPGATMLQVRSLDSIHATRRKIEYCMCLCYCYCNILESHHLHQNTLSASRSCCSQVLGFTLINSTVALAGYYFAAFTVDRPWMGRRRMQIMGFAWMFVLFMLCAWQYQRLTQPSHLWIFRALYYLSR